MKPAGGGIHALAWARRHPYLLAALALHALAAAALYAAGPMASEQQQRQAAQARLSSQLDAARREQVQRHLSRLEQLDRELNAQLPALPADAASRPLDRARALTERIEAAEQRARAAELARLLKISPEQARARLQAQETAKPPALAADPAHALAQLDRRARDAAERLRQAERRSQEGVAVGGASRGAGAGAGAGGGRAAGAEPGNGLGGVGEPERTYAPDATPPPLDPARLRFAEGRRFGPGAPFANRIYLDRWNVIGPFPAASSRALGQVFPPELVVDLDGAYEGRDGLVRWQPQHSPVYPFVPEPRSPDAVYYAATEIHLDRATDAWLDLGVDDDARLWLNGALIWVSGNAGKPWYRRPFYQLDGDLARYGLVESRVRVTLPAGRNTLLLKLYNGIDLMFFSVVIAR